MNNNITKAVFRYLGVYLDINREDINMESETTAPILAFIARLKGNGFCVSEELLHALNAVSVDTLAGVIECVDDIMGGSHNWAPLVKNWGEPTGESYSDHLATWFANMFGGESAGIDGCRLPCGHFIPKGTFPVERYNGCPFCGTQFATSDFVYMGQGTELKVLRLFTDEDMKNLCKSLLESVTPLDATQRDTLELLLAKFPLPDELNIRIRETVMLVIKLLVEQGRAEEAGRLMNTPTDVLRYLWFEKTGLLQIVEPKTLIANVSKMYRYSCIRQGRKNAVREQKKKLRLKYNRKECLRVALWMNALPVTAQQAAENMKPKRGMWVRMIRALRLSEYSHKTGMEHLAEILDVFYKQDYDTWQGRVDRARIEHDADATLALLKQRPGLFARSLFATMLRFGSDKVLAAFDEIADQLPASLLLSLGNAAITYFDIDAERVVRPVTGNVQHIKPNKLLVLYADETRKQMVRDVQEIYKCSLERRFAAQKTESKTMYIEPALYKLALCIGDRTTTILEMSGALMGTRFPVEGDVVRLFLQWGKGLHAQHLDMDLSCRIALSNGATDYCYFGNLVCYGAKHSGDIQRIPEKVGAAEYIELSLPELEAEGAKYVTFACNSYTAGPLSPNLMVGWMNAAHPMAISETNGVAYDPSCVQHMIRISNDDLSKGLVFGVLDVAKREIIWLEMAFDSQVIHDADFKSIEALLRRLERKMTVGELLEIKSRGQSLELVDSADAADESYTHEWAYNSAEVTRLLDI